MKKILSLICFGILTTVCVVSSWIAPFYLLWSIVFTILLCGTYLFYLVTYLINHKWQKIGLLTQICSIAIVFLFIILYYTGFLSHFQSIEEIQKWFDSFGALAWVIFFIIQILQVVVLPIPAQLTTIAGVLIFGPLITFIISGIAILLGSFICFAIGRHLGIKILYKISSKETIDKYRTLLTQKGKILLPIMFLFPAFPDDLICFIAGTTKITWPYFIIVTITTRLIGIGCTCWLGSGDLIPFHGWGIPIWIIIGVGMIFIIYFLLRYQERVEEWIIATFTKNGKTKLKAKKDRKLKEQIIENSQKNQQENYKNYVNFENAYKTKDEYINFQEIQNSSGIKPTEK